uniref:SAM domain-containing protein n=1 Tax=Globodera rostochiensis TaxID=31243 RepID=A0A914HFN3_GLORO
MDGYSAFWVAVLVPCCLSSLKMRRRFLGQKQSSKNASSKRLPSSAISPPADLLSSRRSFVGEGTPVKGKEANCALMAGNKYATIGRFAKKWPWDSYRPLYPPTMPLAVEEKCRPRGDGEGGEALNGDAMRRRPQSMAKANGRREVEDDEIAAAGPAGDRRMSEALQFQEEANSVAPGVLFHSASAGGNNRNSTGSTNSSQASSGFESAKSASSHHLATSASSGSCSSGVCSSATVVHHQSSVHPPNASPDGTASSSSRLSSAGSSTQGRSSAYFSLSDGLDSSIGPGGTLTVQKRAKGPCPRVNITEMIARGIPEAEIFAEWLQRLCLSEYLALFLGQGYDLPTLARASPEDLTTLGITRPEDRKRLFQDIQAWRNLKDNWPTNLALDANARDWLSAIGLKQYINLFEQQGYLNVGNFEQLEPEDLEDIGVKKLGHIKRICLALKKLRSFRLDAAEASAACPLLCLPSSSICPMPSRASSFSPSPEPLPHSDQNCPRISFNGITTDCTRKCTWREDGDQSVQFRNISFEGEPTGEQSAATDRGPPRLNLYRTSQIIAQLPRDPPPEFNDDEEEEHGQNEKGGKYSQRARRHRPLPPPPPAPVPFSSLELLTLPSSSISSSAYLRLFSSQPTTPRHAQKTFPHSVMEDQPHPVQQRHLLSPETLKTAPMMMTTAILPNDCNH